MIWSWGLTAEWHREVLWMAKMCYIMTVLMLTQLFAFVKTHQIIHLKLVTYCMQTIAQ